MNKVTKTFAMTFALVLSLMVGALVVGCKSSTEPAANQQYDSEAAADDMASGLGTESGGAGTSFADVNDLAAGKQLSGIIPGKDNPMSHNAQYDSTTGLHTITVDRSRTFGKYKFSATIEYQYTYFDASGKFMQNFQKGVTDKITVAFTKSRTQDLGDRLDVDDSANGSWTISAIVSGAPMFNGTFSRNGTDVFHTVANGDRTFTHSYTITFTNDQLVKDADNDHVYLKGPATSHYTATTPKGYTITRDTKITFNGDGTAELDITRTSGDGTVDTITIDVKVGVFKRWGR
jgi:hypothetical protein